jgi:hypothetical protein
MNDVVFLHRDLFFHNIKNSKMQGREECLLSSLWWWLKLNNRL